VGSRWSSSNGAHTKLDRAVFDAYGWTHNVDDQEILARLLALKLERAAGQSGVARGERPVDYGAEG